MPVFTGACGRHLRVMSCYLVRALCSTASCSIAETSNGRAHSWWGPAQPSPVCCGRPGSASRHTDDAESICGSRSVAVMRWSSLRGRCAGARGSSRIRFRFLVCARCMCSPPASILNRPREPRNVAACWRSWTSMAGPVPGTNGRGGRRMSRIRGQTRSRREHADRPG